MKDPTHATKDSAAEASASALKWLKASVRFPSVFAWHPCIASPTGPSSFCRPFMSGFLHAEMASITPRSATKAFSKTATPSTTWHRGGKGEVWETGVCARARGDRNVAREPWDGCGWAKV